MNNDVMRQSDAMILSMYASIALPQRRKKRLRVGATIAFLAIFFLGGCGCGEAREYFIKGRWERCQRVFREACGLTLRCGLMSFECVQNVEVRGGCIGVSR